MSNLIATISDIETYQGINIVKFKHKEITLSMMSLDVSDDIKLGTKVKLVVKPTHISIAKNLSGEFSYSNQLSSTVVSLENGKLLSSIKLDYNGSELESIITLASSKKMNLQVGDKVTAFIKASDLSIGEVIYD